MRHSAVRALTRRRAKTAAGTALLPAARAVVSTHRDFASRADELRGLSSGLIRIGTFSSVATH